MARIGVWLEKALEYAMAAMLAVMVVMVFGNVVLRYGWGGGIASAEEISRLMFVWLVFLGAILALTQHKHLGLELLVSRLPVPVRRIFAIISHLLILYALWLFLAGSWTQVQIGFKTYSTVLRFPMAFYSAAGLVASIAMIGVVLLNLWRMVTGAPGGHMPGDPHPDHEHEPIAPAGADETPPAVERVSTNAARALEA
jgi:TRAP-type C4-dicarboxylate transport system permease small subunit